MTNEGWEMSGVWWVATQKRREDRRKRKIETKEEKLGNQARLFVSPRWVLRGVGGCAELLPLSRARGSWPRRRYLTSNV